MTNLDIIAEELSLRVTVDLIDKIQAVFRNASLEIVDDRVVDSVIDHLMNNDIRTQGLIPEALSDLKNKVLVRILRTRKLAF